MNPLPLHLLSRTRRGSALAATMMVVLALVTFLSIAALVTSQFGRFTARAEGDNELTAAGDAGLEYLYAQWENTAFTAFSGGGAPTSNDFGAMNGTRQSDGTYVTPANLGQNGPFQKALNGTGLPFKAAGITFSDAHVNPADVNGVEDVSSTKIYGTPNGNVPGYQGWNGTAYTYKATVTLSPSTTNYHYGFFASNNSSLNSAPKLTLTRYFQVNQVPLFQAAIFYENKLEIHPGAPMKVTGLVHTNGDLWARGFQSLEFAKQVSYVGKFTPTADPSLTAGWDGFGMGQIPGYNVNGSPAPTLDSTNTKVSPIDPFGGAPQADNSLHKIVDVPAAGSADASNNQLAYNNSQLVIKVDSTPNSTTPIAITSVASDGTKTAITPTTDPTDYNLIKAAVTVGSGNTFYDQREASNVTATTLDMGKLALATAPLSAATTVQKNFLKSQPDPNSSSGKKLSSGTVYIYDQNTSGTNLHAIRLTNGSNLGQNVTVASTNPVYILGDYNTGDTGTKVVSNNTNSDGTVPTNGTYNRYSSAVMADAVTILSSAWQDGQSSQPLYNTNSKGQITGTSGYRTAAATTVNTAILAGDIPSNYNNNGIPSGGAHNFPRFLENWNGINFTYYGSLVEAFRSVTADNPWQTGQVYYWPNRRWWFDTNFLTTQPPGVPNGIQYSRGRWARTNG